MSRGKKDSAQKIIKIDGKYGIAVADTGYALMRWTGKSWTSEGYWSTVAKCLRQYVSETIHDELSERECAGVAQAAEVIQGAVRRCEAMIAAVFPEYEVREHARFGMGQ